jgi:hypothetical protein
MCISRFLASIFSKSHFQLKRKKSQGLGSQGAICNKNGRPYIFLNELCESHNLQKSGSKQDVMLEWLRNYFFYPERVPDYVSEHFPDLTNGKKLMKKI